MEERPQHCNKREVGRIKNLEKNSHTPTRIGEIPADVVSKLPDPYS
jgi:hypothetical protein